EDSIVAEAAASCGLSSTHATQLADSIRNLFAAARKVEARSLEINPLVLTKDGQFVAADCRITIDDYAVARHPELKIEIAREFDHPPTPLERVAYAVEQNDHRGTFYFAQLATTAAKDSEGLVGFHVAGGGGSARRSRAIVRPTRRPRLQGALPNLSPPAREQNGNRARRACQSSLRIHRSQRFR